MHSRYSNIQSSVPLSRPLGQLTNLNFRNSLTISQSKSRLGLSSLTGYDSSQESCISALKRERSAKKQLKKRFEGVRRENYDSPLKAESDYGLSMTVRSNFSSSGNSFLKRSQEFSNIAKNSLRSTYTPSVPNVDSKSLKTSQIMPRNIHLDVNKNQVENLYSSQAEESNRNVLRDSVGFPINSSRNTLRVSTMFQMQDNENEISPNSKFEKYRTYKNDNDSCNFNLQSCNMKKSFVIDQRPKRDQQLENKIKEYKNNRQNDSVSKYSTNSGRFRTKSQLQNTLVRRSKGLPSINLGLSQHAQPNNNYIALKQNSNPFCNENILKHKSKSTFQKPQPNNKQFTFVNSPKHQEKPSSHIRHSSFTECTFKSTTLKQKTNTSQGNSEISLNDFQLGSMKGQGRFGKFFPAIHKKSGMFVGIKQVKKQSLKHMLDQFIQELKIQSFIDHPNIVKLYGYFATQEHFYFILEYMEEGSLFHFIKKKKKIQEAETSSKLKQVCSAVEYLHQNEIIHRDIKPQNIVLTCDVCKLCDFGWAAICNDRRKTYCGTLDYVCPQILQGDSYDDCVDIWAIGVMAYEMIVGKAPFYNISKKQTMKRIMECDFQLPKELSDKAKDFIKKALRKKTEQRCTIEMLTQDAFIKE